MSTREFHFTEGTSDKFWRISVEGSTFTVQFGRAGTAGQTQTKEFASEAAAAQAAEKLVQEKGRKGYLEQGGAKDEGALKAEGGMAQRAPAEDEPASTSTSTSTSTTRAPEPERPTPIA